MSASKGPDLIEIQQENLGFKAIAGENKLKLTEPWPADSHPPPTASLLSVASVRGLVAAAGPRSLTITTTEDVRRAFEDGDEAGGLTNTKIPKPSSGNSDWNPKVLSLPVPRVNQLYFSSDESCLVIAAEQGGGLAVYDTNAIVNGKTEPEFQIATNGSRVQHLLPNPNPSDALSHLFGVVLENGQLLLANLKSRELSKTSSGSPVFHEGVTCACWSRLGKQVFAGKSDGTAVQIDPQGVVKAQIPVPPGLSECFTDSRAAAYPVMNIYWLDTNQALLVHTPVYPPEVKSSDQPPEELSAFHLASRENAKSNEWVCQKLADPAAAFMQEGRAPAHYHIQRLKDWPPNLEDMLVLISTLSDNVGLIAKSGEPVIAGFNVENEYRAGTYLTAGTIDSRRAGLPMPTYEESGKFDVSAIGMALDLSDTKPAKQPIATDRDVDNSITPLPLLYIFNDEGLLNAWYIVYNEAIRAGQENRPSPFPDLIAAGGPRSLDPRNPRASPALASPLTTAMSNSSQTQAAPLAASPAFGQPAFGQPSAPSSGTPAFGQASKPAFGQATVFGGPSPLGGGQATQSPAAPAFGSGTAFGKPSNPGTGSGFGQVGGMGMNKPSPWGAPQPSTSASKPTFGQASTPFGGNASAQSPFSAFAKKDEASKAGSIFGGGGGGGGGGQTMSPFGGVGASANIPNPFGAAKSTVPKEKSFGSTATLGTDSSFGGGSTFGGSLFGTPSQGGSSTFGQPSQPTTSREETMEDDHIPTPGEQKPQGGLFGTGASGFKLGSTFKGDGSAKDDLPKPQQGSGFSFFGGGFGSALGDTEKKNADQNKMPIKEEPGMEKRTSMNDIPPASARSGVPSTQMPRRFFGDIPPVEPEPKAEEDPLKYKPKRFGGDLPPVDVPGGDEPAQKESPESSQKSKNEEEAPIAGSPPIDVSNEKFSETAGSEDEVPAGPADEEDDWEEDEDEDDDGEDDDENEGDGDEDDEDDEEPDHTVTNQKALNSLMSRITPAKGDSKAQESTTPTTTASMKQQSFTPAGFPQPHGNSIFKPTPARPQLSPRSPSPQRSVTAPMRSSLASQQQRQPQQAQNQQRSSSNLPPPSQPARIAVPPAGPVQRQPTPQPTEPTEGELQDAEDARVKDILAKEPDPSRELPLFLAHQNYVGEGEKPGIGGQIEKVFRDVNSMLDTLGLNAHGLRGFIEGQLEFRKPGGRSIEDLENAEAWTLAEISALGNVQQEIEERLEEGRLEDVQETMEDTAEELEELSKLRVTAEGVRKAVKAHTDPDALAAQRASELPEATKQQQADLRQAVQDVQALLSQVEEATTLLRAELASASVSHQAATKVPTVEAVTNTILKMTAMIEKRSGDIDVLESQIKRLPKGLASLHLNDDYEDQLSASLAGSRLLPNGTPTASRSRMLADGSAPGMSTMFGRSSHRTPPSASLRRSVAFTPEASRLGMSTHPLGFSGSLSASGGRKKMVDVSEEEVGAYLGKVGRRRRVLESLRERVEGRGARVVRLEG
ncbi:nucleoporin [Teratosphaeria destructans]|uniref:Nucleoporin n=1 Tax=Teratosphaeria destructans TaxID=418781 RepID=A0A9W7SQ04_9PEZI|nr:nucleoporin [Teratosphaeria destructans]